jgi:hypothetical protein
VKRARLATAFAFAAAASICAGMETAQWPPPPEVLGHMRDLQAKINDPNTPKEERAAARAELQKLLRSPASVETPTPPRARAAIDPFPSVVKPIEGKLPGPPPPTARLEVIPEPPRRPAVNPATGSVIPPATGMAVDPRNGRVLHEVPGGYVDPRSGQFVPR